LSELRRRKEGSSAVEVDDRLSQDDLGYLRFTYPDYREMLDDEIQTHWRDTGQFEWRVRNWREAAERQIAIKGALPDRFNESVYLELNQDLVADYSAPFAATWHYLALGKLEGRVALKPLMTEQETHLRTYRVFDPIDVEVDASLPVRVNVLVPAFDLENMSAGFFGVFEIASWLDELGYRVRLVLFENFGFYMEPLKKNLSGHPGLHNLLDRVELAYLGERRSPLRVSPDDMAVATVWYSAYLAQRIQSLTTQGPFLYLIQDDESNFHPSGANSVLAANTYAMDFVALVSSESLYRHFCENVAGTIRDDPSRAAPFHNASSRSRGGTSQRSVEATKTFVYYSRPTVDRNAFDLGIQAIRVAVQTDVLNLNEWRFIGIGIGEMDVEIAEGHYLEQLKRLSIKDYRKAISDFDAGLSLMISPHPSLVPVDLAGSGVPVVTNVYGTKTAEYLQGISRNIVPAELNVDSLVLAIQEAVLRAADPALRAQGARDLSWPTDWSSVLVDEHVRLIERAWIPAGTRPSRTRSLKVPLSEPLDRVSVLLRGLQPEDHVGAEIGPFFSPIAPKSGGWQTVVVDAYDAEVLRDKAKNHESSAVRDSAHLIEEVDVVWAGEPLSEVAALVERAPLDYVIASHVIEHVPDLLGFVTGAASLLGPEGVLSLAVPDARYCFDGLRHVSMLGDVLQAHRERRNRHQPETIFSQIAYGLNMDGDGSWVKGSTGDVSLMSSLEWANDQYSEYVEKCQDDPAYYMDCHAWVFTPSSFELLIFELGLLGLTDLRVDSIDQRTFASEFFVRLSRSAQPVPREDADARRLALLLEVRAELADVLYRARVRG
jgi:hypothetical protein